jgi:hypothetical protein
MCLRTQVACGYAQLLVPASPCGQEAIPSPPEVGAFLANCYEPISHSGLCALQNWSILWYK